MCKGCSICIEVCPNHVLEISTNINKLGYYAPIVKYMDKCKATCTLCELICPDFAIFKQELKENDS